MKPTSLCLLVCCALLFGACTTPPNVEYGPNGTIAYLIEVESSEPGARVEADGDYVGKTPIQIKLFGDGDGTFHDFGRNEYVIKVFATRPGQYTQTRIFHTGRWFSQQDRIPKRLYFDLNEKTEGFTVDLPKPIQPAQ
jgi:PEGA domain